MPNTLMADAALWHTPEPEEEDNDWLDETDYGDDDDDDLEDDDDEDEDDEDADDADADETA